MSSWISHLSRELFWDVEPSTVEPERHGRWLLERVVERGRWEDWLLVRDNLGKSAISELLPTLRIDAKSRHFLNLFCGT